MTKATVYFETGKDAVLERTEDTSRIAVILEEIGVKYEKWPIDISGLPDTSETTIFTHFAPEIARLEQRATFQSKDVLHVDRDDPDRKLLRA